MSFQTLMTFRSESPKGNALRFATKEEADAYGRDLYSRWMQPTGFIVEESTDPVTHFWNPGSYRAEAYHG